MLKYEVTRVDTTLSYWRHNDEHRKYGPARIWDDSEMRWYQYGLRHRKDGPARIWERIGLWQYWIYGIKQC